MPLAALEREPLATKATELRTGNPDVCIRTSDAGAVDGASTKGTGTRYWWSWFAMSQFWLFDLQIGVALGYFSRVGLHNAVIQAPRASWGTWKAENR
jgi:hypothetical protein